MNYLQYNTEKI